MYITKNFSLTLLSVVLAGRADSARPRGTQGMKGPWAIGLNFEGSSLIFISQSYVLTKIELVELGSGGDCISNQCRKKEDN